MQVRSVAAAASGKVNRTRLGYAGWGMADQAASSLSNFGVGLVAARASTTEEYGSFSIAFTTAVIGIGVVRAVISEVYSVRFAGSGVVLSAGGSLDPGASDGDAFAEFAESEAEIRTEEREGQRSSVAVAEVTDPDEVGPRYPHAGGALGASLLLAAMLSVVCAAAGMLASGSLQSALFVLAVGVPALVVQDVVRFVCVARRDPFGATLSDTTWVVAFALAVAVWAVTQGSFPNATASLGCWVVGAAFGAAVGFARLRSWPHLVQGIAFARLVWRQSTRYLVDWLALGASFHVGYYVLGISAGLAVVGEYRAALLLGGPLNILVMGAVMILVPEITRYRRRTGNRLIKVSAAISLGLVVLSLAWLVPLLLLPEAWLEKILGDSAVGAKSLLPFVALELVVGMLAQGPLVCLRATGDVRRGTRASLPAAPFYLFGGAIGAAVIGGAEGALIGASVSVGVAGLCAAYQLVQATRDAPITFVDDPVSAGGA